jgi:iron complex transport system permease protein
MSRTLHVCLLLLAALLLTGLGSLLHDSGVSLHVLLHPSSLPALESQLLWQLRLPRLLMAACSGMLLGCAGSAVQARFCNPLAEPGLLGIYSGAALAAALALSLDAGLMAVSLAGFAAACWHCACCGRWRARPAAPVCCWLALPSAPCWPAC